MRLFPRSDTDLLPREAAGETWLAGVIAVLCFIACLAAVGAASADRAAQGWARQLRAEATVQVRPRVGETGPTAAARAAETLAGTDGVAEAVALDRKAAEDLLRPWLGEAVLPDMPLPFLVTVRLDPDAPASAVTLSRALATAGLDASVDDHAQWRGDVERSAALITVLAGVAFLLTAGAAAAAIVYATRAGLMARRSVIETLSLAGASDAAIAWLFQRRFGLLAAGAGAVGMGLALLVTAGVRFLGGGAGLVPALPLAWSDAVLILPCPLIAAGVAMISARLAALSRLSGPSRHQKGRSDAAGKLLTLLRIRP